MAQNLKFDAQKKDYVLSPTGSSIPSDDVLEAVYYAVAIPQNQWLWGDPNQGSKMYTLDNVKRTASIEQQIAGYLTDAVERQVISTGRATAVQVRNLDATRTGTVNQLAVIPAEVQVSNLLDFVAV